MKLDEYQKLVLNSLFTIISLLLLIGQSVTSGLIPELVFKSARRTAEKLSKALEPPEEVSNG